MRVIEHLVKTLRDSAIFNPEVQVAPSCILWPDKDRQWEAVIPRLQSELAELLVLGDYAPESRTGPAIWLRCVIAGKAPDVTLPADRVPVFYLPGVSRQDLRAIEDCPDLLKSFASLKAPVDEFFDKVMVMADDKAVRANRLALLRDLRDAMNQVADLSKLAT